MRFAEVGLLLIPVFLYVMWHRAIRRGERGPSRPLLAGTLLVLVAAATGLGWFASHDGQPAGATYVPAQTRDGVIIPAHTQ